MLNREAVTSECLRIGDFQVLALARSTNDRIAMSQQERDVLQILQLVHAGSLTQVEAARLLRLSSRQVRRLLRRLADEGDQAVVHRLRGKPSNHRIDPALRRKILTAYRRDYSDFGPTFASEKLAEQGLAVSPETLRQWLLAEGLWHRQRRRDPHRQRRPRRSCFGELVQMDTSIHDWTEGRGEPMVLVNMIDDATSRILSGFYEGETVEAHFDLLGRWIQRYGRPRALYTDRDSIFEYQDKGRGDPSGVTQFGRALAELDIELILARSPQAKGRVERFFETAQDRPPRRSTRSRRSRPTSSPRRGSRRAPRPRPRPGSAGSGRSIARTWKSRASGRPVPSPVQLNESLCRVPAPAYPGTAIYGRWWHPKGRCRSCTGRPGFCRLAKTLTR
jgi:hypothetical protein